MGLGGPVVRPDTQRVELFRHGFGQWHDPIDVVNQVIVLKLTSIGKGIYFRGFYHLLHLGRCPAHHDLRPVTHIELPNKKAPVKNANPY